MVTEYDNKAGICRDSFAGLFQHYAVGLLVYARQFVQRHEVAEDIVHDVFINLWEKKENISPDTAKQYLFRATRNSCLNYLTHLKSRTKYQNEILREQDLPDSLDPDYYIYSELKATIEAAIDKLPPQRKAIFMMNRFDRKTFAEIAEEMNLSPRTVDKHIELALRDLRKELVDYLAIIAILYKMGMF